jgi:hypothetical protein
MVEKLYTYEGCNQKQSHLVGKNEEEKQKRQKNLCKEDNQGHLVYSPFLGGMG